MDTVKGAAIAAAVASMMGAGVCASEAPLAGGREVLLAANACKGKSACSAGNNVQVDDASTNTVDKTGKNNTCKGQSVFRAPGVTEDMGTEWELFDAMLGI